MNYSRLLIWAVSINGEGSSRVSFDLIRASPAIFRDVTCVVSSESVLYRQLCASDLSASIRLVVLPSLFRQYYVQFFVKLLLPLFVFADLALVVDDFPFLIPYRQVIYLHQPNLLYPRSLMWRSKALVFAFLSFFKPRISVQTEHMRKQLSLRYGYPLNKISVSYHAPAC